MLALARGFAKPCWTLSTRGTVAGIGPGSPLGRRYRVDLVLDRGSAPALLATRFPDGEKVLVRILRHPLLERRGPLLVHLFRDAKVVAALERPDLCRILEFDIDPRSTERMLVLEYDHSRTAAQIVDPNGREERTVLAFLQIAGALVERHDYDAVHTTDADAVAPPGAVIRAPPAAEAQTPPEEEWIHVRATEVPAADPPPKERVNFVALLALAGSVALTALFIFREDRGVEPPPPQYPWYHNYSTGAPTEFSADPNDPYAHDPDVRRMRAIRIVLTSSPLGAAVWDGFRRVGVTPMVIARPKRGDTRELRVSKPGFTERDVMVEWNSPKRIEVGLDGMLDELEATEKLIKDLRIEQKRAEDVIAPPSSGPPLGGGNRKSRPGLYRPDDD